MLESRERRIETRYKGAMEVRPATAGDLAACTAIYNHYVETTHMTFDTAPFTEEQRRPWFSQFAATGPHRLFVATDDSRGVVGYASSTPFRQKPAYATSVETTIYLAPDAAGRGIGRALYQRLLDTLAEEDVHRAYAGIALPNRASVAFHEGLGFRLAGSYREVGHKLGRFWDVAWFERELA